MIEISDDVWNVMEGTLITGCRVESWRGGDLLAAEIPVISGTYEGDRSQALPDRVELTVPVEAAGVRYDPLYEDDPLAPYGQRLRVSIGLQVHRKFVWIPRGEFLVTSTTRDDDTVTVEAVSLLQLVAEARLIAPLQPATGDTFKRLVRRLVEPALPVVFDSGLVDRAVPVANTQFEDSRLDALYELATAWPAQLRVHPDGYLLVEPVPTPTADDWIDDARDAISRVTATTSRDGAINVVVVTSSDETTDEPYQGLAYDTDEASPTRWGGPFNPLPVPLYYDSPLLTSDAECRKAAASLLVRRKRTTTRSITQDMSPAPYLELGDVVRTRDDRAGSVSGTIETIKLPLTPDAGAMTLTLAVL